MSIETECPGCSRRLSVAAEHAGQQARCPVCNTIYTVPGEESRASDAESEPRDEWRMRTPEGQLFGPTSREELDTWVSEGRVTADCELLHTGTTKWVAAGDVYSVLVAPAPVEPPRQESANRYRYTTPHRGVVILVLGILSWVVACPIFGFAAWVMGNADLQEMRAGRMDPSGRGLTHAGTILGMIQSMIVIVVGAIFLFVFLARIAARL